MSGRRANKGTRIKTRDKRLDALLQEVSKAGWEVTRGSKHIRCKSPDGKNIVTMSVSPRNPWRAWHGARADFRRAGLDV